MKLIEAGAFFGLLQPHPHPDPPLEGEGANQGSRAGFPSPLQGGSWRGDRVRRSSRRLLQAALLLLAALPVHAHDGHDHGPVAPPPPTEAAARAVAVSEDFELVAVLEKDALRLYLDRFASNEPVSGATLDLESGAFKARALAEDPGVYSVPRTWAKPGKHPLTFTLQAGDSTDLLTTTLEAPAHRHDDSPLRWMEWGASSALALLGAGAYLVWRRRRA